MRRTQIRLLRWMRTSFVVLTLAGVVTATNAAGQIRRSRGTFQGDNVSAAVGPRGAVVKGDEGAAAVGRRGAAVVGEEGYAAAGRRGAVVKGESGGAAVGRRGVVVAGEDGYAAAGRYGGVVVGNRYESYEAWRAVTRVGTTIAVGTMLARPPTGATTVVVGGTTYWLYQDTYFTRVYSGGSVVYQVVPPPR